MISYFGTVLLVMAMYQTANPGLKPVPSFHKSCRLPCGHFNIELGNLMERDRRLWGIDVIDSSDRNIWRGILKLQRGQTPFNWKKGR